MMCAVVAGAFLGTELWEANLRNGGQAPPQPTSKTPWGHTPTTNIGGTWGEDDDAQDSANVWTGPPPPQQWAGAPPQHAQQGELTPLLHRVYSFNVAALVHSATT